MSISNRPLDTRAELRPAPRRDRPNRRETYVPVLCPVCQAERWLTRSTARRAERNNTRCLSCSNHINGKAGYEATVQKYGCDFLIQKGIDLRIAHPSYLEGIVTRWLDEAGVLYRREVVMHHHDRDFIVDFVVDETLVLEVNGWGHNLPERQQRDHLLCEALGDRLMILDGKRIKGEPERVKRELFAAIAREANCVKSTTPG